MGSGIQLRRAGLGGIRPRILVLLSHGVLLAHRHEDELAEDSVGVVGELHGASGDRVGGRQRSAGHLGMLENGAKVLDADDDMQLVLDFNIVKFIHLDRNVRVKGLLEDGWTGWLAPGAIAIGGELTYLHC